MDLSSPIEEIPRIGPQYQKRLKKMGIKTAGDLLFHFPHRYEDFSNLIPIAKAEKGGPFCFQGKVLDIKNIITFRKRMVLTQATIADETGELKVIWFNQPYLINTFKKGTYLCLAGKITGKGSSKYLSNPAYEKLNHELEINNHELTHTGRLVPVYPETEGLSSKWLRFIIKPLLERLRHLIPDFLPIKISQKYDFLPFQTAIWQIHFPDSQQLAERAKKRFAFEELFNLALLVLRERMKLNKEKAFPIPINLDLIKEFTKTLPFKLTDAQKKSAWQILKDLEKPRPMNRLLEGDVGSGKTVVAALVALNVVKAGYQVAFMAPTEILANQHFKTINEILKNFRAKKTISSSASTGFRQLKTGLITGKESYYKNKRIGRKELLEKIREGKVDILIGTHALIQPPTKSGEGVRFGKLALVIIDEQHRFGVEQRASLCRQTSKIKHRKIPHLLSMTATPIPRTLSLTVYGDLDLSLIDELPKGRKKIITKIIQPKDKKATYNFIRREIKNGRQAFVICPRIEIQNSNLKTQNLSWVDVKAVKEEYEKLSKEIFPDLKIGMLHGKMKSQEKEKIMKNFKEGRINILVSTSVVEVGVDVPNATVMMIEGSEKFGLAQLHQFRGRVGRSDFQSYCFLFTDSPGIVTNRRLKALISCENGFELAEKDLSIRGPGDFTGQRQWGIPDLAMAHLTDSVLVSQARNEAKEILTDDPELKNFPLLREKVKNLREKIHLE